MDPSGLQPHVSHTQDRGPSRGRSSGNAALSLGPGAGWSGLERPSSRSSALKGDELPTSGLGAALETVTCSQRCLPSSPSQIGRQCVGVAGLSLGAAGLSLGAACPSERPASVMSPGPRTPRHSHPGVGNVPSFARAESDVGLHLFLVLRPHLETGKWDSPSPNHQSPSCDVSQELFGDSERWQQPNRLGCTQIAKQREVGHGGAVPSSRAAGPAALSPQDPPGPGDTCLGFWQARNRGGTWFHGAQQPC